MSDYDQSDKRRRVNLACNFCRSRKIRCGGGDVCANCAAGNMTCEYTKVTAEQNRVSRERKAASKAMRLAREANDCTAEHALSLVIKRKLGRPRNIRRSSANANLNAKSCPTSRRPSPLLIRQHSFPAVRGGSPSSWSGSGPEDFGLLTPPYELSQPNSPTILSPQEFQTSFQHIYRWAEAHEQFDYAPASFPSQPYPSPTFYPAFPDSYGVKSSIVPSYAPLPPTPSWSIASQPSLYPLPALPPSPALDNCSVISSRDSDLHLDYFSMDSPVEHVVDPASFYPTPELHYSESFISLSEIHPA